MEAKQHAAEGEEIARILTERIRTTGLRETSRRVGMAPPTMQLRLERDCTDMELREVLAVVQALGMRLTLSYEPASAVGGMELARRVTRGRRQGPGK